MSRKRKQKAKNTGQPSRGLRTAHPRSHPEPMDAIDKNQLSLYPDSEDAEDATAGDLRSSEITMASDLNPESPDHTQESVVAQPAQDPLHVVDETTPMESHAEPTDVPSTSVSAANEPLDTGNAVDSVSVQDAGRVSAPCPVDASPSRNEPHADAAGATPADGAMDGTMPHRADNDAASLGATLRLAREARDWSMNDVGQQLRLPVRIIERLEKDDYAGMTQGVYLRGYLTSYVKLLDVPLDLALRAADSHIEAVPLVATDTTSHSRYLFDRYSVSATYLILTALIVAPAVWLATHGGLEQNLARTLPLDGALITEPAVPQDMTGSSARIAASEKSGELEVDPPPVISSIASFPSASAPVNTATSGSVPGATENATAAHHFTLKLSGESWVEILDAEGNRVEYGLLPQGTDQTYEVSGPLTVHLGNASAVELQVDGRHVDLEPYQNANVARLTLFDDSAAPESSSNE